MTATTEIHVRPGLIARLLGWWFTVPAETAQTGGQEVDTHEDLREDLCAALQVASMCQVSALSADYAHYLMDRHARRLTERGVNQANRPVT